MDKVAKWVTQDVIHKLVEQVELTPDTKVDAVMQMCGSLSVHDELMPNLCMRLLTLMYQRAEATGNLPSTDERSMLS